MIKKVRKNAGWLSGWMLAIALTGAVPAEASSVMSGSSVQATPFDQKIDRSGVLTDLFPIEQTQTADQLFFAARSIRYVKDDVTADYWQTPEETQARWAGDCEDKAVWLFAQLKRNGYQGVRLVIGRFRNGFHVWVTMPDDIGGYFILDPTAHKRIWNASDFPDGYYTPLYSFDGMQRYRHEA